MHQRRILFLQGPPSPFWPELAAGFEAAGARALRINLSTSDALFWRRRGAAAYRGRFAGWRDFVRGFMAAEHVTDVIYFNDRNPYHIVARQVAEEMGAQPQVLEFGYLRPGWLTLEQGGMGAWSHFPADPATIRAVAARCGPQPAEGFQAHPLATEIAFEVCSNLVNQYAFAPFPFYRTDRVHNATYDYLSGLRHWIAIARRRKQAEAIMAPLLSGAQPFVLFALQMQSDYQIRDNTRHRDQRVALAQTIASFARHAPTELSLLIKLHPYDTGLIDWHGLARRLSAEHGVAPGRVACVDEGPTQALIAASRGVVVSNSTVGMSAIRALKPTFSFGVAVYEAPGLTHQGGLDSFWASPEPVDADFCAAFVQALAGSIQVRGSVYVPEGRKLACGEIVARVLGGGVNGHGGFVDPPPRLAGLQSGERRASQV
ncbi:MAG: capsular biosynthesis protein [Methylobacteriaceae bacterium]|nr:capsular biosynthesis protein [Methylobacteriaceae bacterium]